jgi:succinoglycan biosynthesis protein ExoA
MRVAVLIPARNAEKLLRECVAAVRGQTFPPDAVVIVVAPSDDGTEREAELLAGGVTRVLDNPAGDRASGLNLALDDVDADLVAMVDAQATLAPDYLEAAVRVLSDSAVAVAGGPMRPQGRSPVGRAMAVALRSPFGVGDSQFHFAGAARDVDSVYLGVYRADVLRRVGRYNVALLRTEDDDLNTRIRMAGFRIRLDPAIRSAYRCRETLGAIWRQYFGYGYWKVALATIRSGALRPRHAVPAAFVVGLAVTSFLALAGWWLPLAIIGGAWLALAVAAAVVAPADGPDARLLFPVVALTMHVAYGIGTLAAITSLRRLRAIVRAGARRAEVGR